MYLKDPEKHYELMRKTSFSQRWNEIQKLHAKQHWLSRFLILLLGLTWFSCEKLLSKFYQKTFFTLIVFSINFVFFYLPFYSQAYSFLSIINEGFGLTVFVCAGLGLLMTIPLLSTKTKKHMFKKIFENPSGKDFEHYYLGFWIIFIFYVMVLDVVVILLSIFEALAFIVAQI